jgi:hypothetical protein
MNVIIIVRVITTHTAHWLAQKAPDPTAPNENDAKVAEDAAAAGLGLAHTVTSARASVSMRATATAAANQLNSPVPGGNGAGAVMGQSRFSRLYGTNEQLAKINDDDYNFDHDENKGQPPAAPIFE